MKIKFEYVWLDGYKPEPNLRSKVKVVDYTPTTEGLTIGQVSDWGFDGSSTMQAEGNFSDCYLRPVRLYQNPNSKDDYPTVYVLCEVLDGNNGTHQSNERFYLGEEDEDFWVGFEQEYFIRSGHNQPVLGFDAGGIVDPQGKYYCGVGGHVVGRLISDKHLDMCLNFGINVEGTNAEVALGQWEYQIFAKGKLKAADDLWMSRYFLNKLVEQYAVSVELHPKPITTGEWNGSGLHTNFSNRKMREDGGEQYFNAVFKTFESRTKIHIENYGSDNHLRLTGKFETQSIDKFSWGFSDRGASIRVPKVVGETWKGYLEDRRPGSNADPYKILRVISESLSFAEELSGTLHSMYATVKTDDLSTKYGTLSNDELLEEYKKDEE